MSDIAPADRTVLAAAPGPTDLFEWATVAELAAATDRPEQAVRESVHTLWRADLLKRQKRDTGSGKDPYEYRLTDAGAEAVEDS